MVTIALVSGSTRSGSTNTAALRTIAELAPPSVKASLYEGLADLQVVAVAVEQHVAELDARAGFGCAIVDFDHIAFRDAVLPRPIFKHRVHRKPRIFKRNRTGRDRLAVRDRTGQSGSGASAADISAKVLQFDREKKIHGGWQSVTKLYWVDRCFGIGQGRAAVTAAGLGGYAPFLNFDV